MVDFSSLNDLLDLSRYCGSWCKYIREDDDEEISISPVINVSYPRHNLWGGGGGKYVRT